jgi:hypothetical protein
VRTAESNDAATGVVVAWDLQVQSALIAARRTDFGAIVEELGKKR